MQAEIGRSMQKKLYDEWTKIWLWRWLDNNHY